MELGLDFFVLIDTKADKEVVLGHRFSLTCLRFISTNRY